MKINDRKPACVKNSPALNRKMTNQIREAKKEETSRLRIA